MQSTTQLPILYSFRRCPYAMRARLGIAYSQTPVELREVVLKDKPQAMLDLSPKGTVPVLQVTDSEKKAFKGKSNSDITTAESSIIIDESLDILFWALHQNDPENWLASGVDCLQTDHQTCLQKDIQQLIHINDHVFKANLDRYKYFDRFPEKSQVFYRQQCEVFLSELESRLNNTAFIAGNALCVADAAIFPFIRQFAFVDKAWFDQSPYPRLQAWLERWLNSPLFLAIMKKYPQWQAGKETVIFPD